jgi:hypothetical protein
MEKALQKDLAALVMGVVVVRDGLQEKDLEGSPAERKVNANKQVERMLKKCTAHPPYYVRFSGIQSNAGSSLLSADITLIDWSTFKSLY